MCCAGCLIIGPFSLITTAVSAELGQHESLKGSSKAIATVTAIIDGFGSIGELTLCVYYVLFTVHFITKGKYVDVSTSQILVLSVRKSCKCCNTYKLLRIKYNP